MLCFVFEATSKRALAYGANRPFWKRKLNEMKGRNHYGKTRRYWVTLERPTTGSRMTVAVETELSKHHSREQQTRFAGRQIHAFLQVALPGWKVESAMEMELGN